MSTGKGRRASKEFMVQPASTKTAIRTTVSTNADRRYEPPVLQPGDYTLRIARPLLRTVWSGPSARTRGATRLDETFFSASPTRSHCSTPETAAQLTGVEWMLNLPVPAREAASTPTCGLLCHPTAGRTRYDEAGWRTIVQRTPEAPGRQPINIRELGHRPLVG